MADRIFQRIRAPDVAAWRTAHPDALILDTRDPASHAAGNMAGSTRLDRSNLDQMVLTTTRQRPVLIYCYHGNSSQVYAQQFADFGFAQVVDLIGGWEAWDKFQAAETPTLPPSLATWLAAHGFTGRDAPGAHGNTPLMHAAWKGDDATVEALLAVGARVDAVNNDGNTALWLACVSNDPTIVKRLVAAGADLNHRNTTGATCLMYAASSNKPLMVSTLLSLGADPTIRSLDDFTALDMAASIDCLRLLRPSTKVQYG
jgi:rhodanese-related sulfurtransferase